MPVMLLCRRIVAINSGAAPACRVQRFCAASKVNVAAVSMPGFAHRSPCRAVLDGVLRLADGKSGVGYEYGRLEVFLRGFFSNVCSDNRFTPDSAKVACRELGYDGGAALRFTQAYALSLSQVWPLTMAAFMQYAE